MPETTSIDSAEETFCSFRADSRLFGIRVSALREISTNTVITPVPQAPPGVRGLANLRSRVHLVIDLRPALGLPAAECTPESRLIILKPNVAEDVGILVDQGGDILCVRRERIESWNESSSSAPDSSGETAAAFVVAVCKLDRELMMIIDPSRLVEFVSNAIRRNDALTGKAIS